MIKYTHKDIGCWLDGSFGHEANRHRLADLIAPICLDSNVVRALREPMSDDASEEDKALEWLATATDDSLCWMWDSGDLLLIAD